MKLSIWLGDLGHSEVTRLRVVPLGIGCIASLCVKRLGIVLIQNFSSIPIRSLHN